MAVIKRRYSPAGVLLAITNFVFGVAAILLGLRVILKLFAANPSTPFVEWVYGVSQPLINPFVGIFPTPILRGGYVIEFSALFALFVYALVVFLIDQLIEYFAFNEEIRTSYRDHNHDDDRDE